MSHELRRVPLLDLARQILIRRRRIVVLALAVPLAGAIGFALFMPRSYRASAVVLIERGAGASDDDIDARLSALTSENLRRTRLYALVGRFNLYPELKGRASRELVIDQMQKDLHVDLDKEDRGGRNVAVAIHVTYTARDPRVAADVANDFADFYEREDLRMREDRARYTSTKVQEQLADARRNLDQQETRLKDYKMRHLSELPEQVGLHLSALAQLNSQIRVSRGEPNPFARASNAGPQSAQPEPVRDERLDRLAELRTRYTDEHPDVRQLMREIAMTPRVQKDNAGRPKNAADPPQTQAALEAASRAHVDGIRRAVADLREQAAVHEQGIMNAPFRQQELDALLPDYVAARTRYQSLWEKYEIAELWDPRHDGGRLLVLDPAVPRRQPIAPNIPRILAIGIAVSFAVMAAAVALVERIDTSFHTLDDLRSFTRVPVLATVPRLVTSTERRRGVRGARRFAAMILVLVAFTVAGSAYVSRGTQALIEWVGRIHP